MNLISDAMNAIQHAETLLPGMATEEGIDPRWQAIIAVSEFILTEPDAVWDFIQRWGGHSQEDLRTAIATCLLEHLLECHFSVYFVKVEKLVQTDPLFADTFGRCSQFGQALETGNAERFYSLTEFLTRE